MITEEEYHDLRAVNTEPVLTTTEITQLFWNGWIKFDLPEKLSADIINLQNLGKVYFHTGKMLIVEPEDGGDEADEGYENVAGVKEYITYRRSINKADKLETHVAKIWPKVASLLHGMLCDMSRASGQPPSVWDPIVKGALTLPHDDCPLLQASSILRLFTYEPVDGATPKHSDSGLLTLVFSSSEGLEVLDRRGLRNEWQTAPTCTILLGQSLRALSGNHIRTGIHRVTGQPHTRSSFVFSLRPNLSATVNLRHFGGTGELSMAQMYAELEDDDDSVDQGDTAPRHRAKRVKYEENTKKKAKKVILGTIPTVLTSASNTQAKPVVIKDEKMEDGDVKILDVKPAVSQEQYTKVRALTSEELERDFGHLKNIPMLHLVKRMRGN